MYIFSNFFNPQNALPGKRKDKIRHKCSVPFSTHFVNILAFKDAISNITGDGGHKYFECSLEEIENCWSSC